MTLKRIPTVTPGFEALETFNDQQMKIYWLPDEIHVEKDIQDVLVNFTEAERHAVITVLKLFSIYEDHAGNEYWGGRFKKAYESNNSAVKMASTFSFFETSVHAPFYNKINELLHLDTPEFYLSYQSNPVLVERVKHIGEMIADPDNLVSLASFSMVEGVILYSSFAFLKHYQSKGKNKLMNVVRGINFSVRDENIHSIAGAWCFRHELSKINDDHYKRVLEQNVRLTARKIYEHEKEIISMLFEKGSIEGITMHQLDNFVKSRVNICLDQLGYSKEFDVEYNPIGEWFYKGINDFMFNDFFSGIGNQYHRNWDETAFVWGTK